MVKLNCGILVDVPLQDAFGKAHTGPYGSLRPQTSDLIHPYTILKFGVVTPLNNQLIVFGTCDFSMGRPSVRQRESSVP